jgi:rod shape-determining protein MreB and related proteins
VAALVRDLRVNPPGADVAPAAARGLVLVGGGATQPGLAARLASATRLAVRTATRPRTAAVHGAGLAALAALRRAAATC